MEGSTVIILIPLLFTGVWVMYQFWKLDQMQSEMSDLKEEIGRLQSDVLIKLEREDIMEFDTSFDVALDDIKDTRPEFDFDALERPSIVQFERQEDQRLQGSAPQPWFDMENGKLRRVRRDTGSPVTKNKKRIKRNNAGSPYCMHFTLNQDSVEKSKHRCDDQVKEDVGDVSILCKVKEFPFWHNEMHGVSHAAGHLHDRHSKLEIIQNGTYLVYAQTTFHDTMLGPYYELLRQAADSSEPDILSACAGVETFGTHGSGNTTMLTFNQCHTDRAVYLSTGDRVYLRNRRDETSVIRAEPYLTFWGLFWLSD